MSLSAYPQAILHMDADAFFASVEEALTPSLRGKPIVTGKERGVIACANYAAKAQGIRRGIPLFQARKMCPDLVILPSDYETYGLYSKRMFNIMRRYTPAVEEYSIDEAFADLTGLRPLHRCSYEDIARRIQNDVRNELGITVSVGLSLSKALAKLCSKFRKPRGFTAVPGQYIHLLLERTPLDKVWGFGPNTVNLLQKFGLRTAYDFVLRPRQWAAALLHKPGEDLWNELRGHAVWKVAGEASAPKCTLVRSKTFTPPTNDRAFVYAKLIRNAEDAFAKLRRHRLRAGALGIVLRRHDFRHDGLEVRFSRPTSSALEAMPLIRGLFERLFQSDALYRSTLVALGGFEDDSREQFDLFENRLRIDGLRRVSLAVDRLNRRFGRHTVGSATALTLESRAKTGREEEPERLQLRMSGENPRRRLAIPRMAIRV